MKSIKIAVALILSLGAYQAVACSFDTDCGIGSKCVKSQGSLYGICANGPNPGNKYDRVPVRDPLDLDRTYGNTCSYDTDCGVSNKCYKERGQLKGVCVKGR